LGEDVSKEECQRSSFLGPQGGEKIPSVKEEGRIRGRKEEDKGMIPAIQKRSPPPREDSCSRKKKRWSTIFVWNDRGTVFQFPRVRGRMDFANERGTGRKEIMSTEFWVGMTLFRIQGILLRTKIENEGRVPTAGSTAKKHPIRAIKTRSHPSYFVLLYAQNEKETDTYSLHIRCNASGGKGRKSWTFCASGITARGTAGGGWLLGGSGGGCTKKLITVARSTGGTGGKTGGKKSGEGSKCCG